MWESKVAPLSGLVFVVLMLGSFLVDPNTDYMPPADEIIAYLSDGSLTIIVAAYLRLLSAAALIWFSASLYQSAREADEDDRRLAMLVFGGGVMAASMVVLSSVAIIAAAERAQAVGFIDAAGAAVLFDLAGISVGNAATVGFGVMIGAAGIVLLRTADQSRWTGWVSIILALGLLSPLAWLLLAGVAVWVPAAGVSIYRARRAVEPATARAVAG